MATHDPALDELIRIREALEGGGGGGGDASAANQTESNTRVGATNESAAANPAATAGLNGILKGLWTSITTLIRTPATATATLSTVASSASSAQMLAANASRLGVIVENTDANIAYIKYGTTASLTSFTAKILATDGWWEMPKPIYTGRIDIIWAADGAGSAFVTEL